MSDNLKADCASCFGLCCVVPAFSVSADFAINKPAGHACPNLQEDSRCGIHTSLRDKGFRGCTVYDCFGAGQKVSQVTFGGQDWRQAPRTAREMFDVFPVMRDLHELLWYLTEALTLLPHDREAGARSWDGGPGFVSGPGRDPGSELGPELGRARDETERLSMSGPEAILGLDLPAYRAGVNALLLRASELVRAGVRPRGADHRGADLIGATLGGSDLRGASLRGASLVGADLRGADLGMADLTGADLRGADLRAADLSHSIFLVQSQLDAAKGDGATRLPAALTRPAHWSSG